MPHEALRYDVTPIGLHYLLTHYDIPDVDPEAFRLTIDGHVERPRILTLEDLRARPSVTAQVTLECAGNGRVLLEPRAISQPWLRGAVGNAEWTGTPLAPLLAEAGPRAGAVDVAFAGLDHGLEGDVEQDYERGLSLREATRPDLILAYAMNGQPLPPQHGFPLRLIVPGWYGMAHVKWLGRIRVLDGPFTGYQNMTSYRLRESEEDPGTPIETMRVRSLMVLPGFSSFLPRRRILEAGSVPLRSSLVRERRRSLASRSAPTAAQPGPTRTWVRSPSRTPGGRGPSMGGVSGSPHGVQPCHGRRRRRPAGRSGVEHGRLSEQRDRADRGRGPGGVNTRAGFRLRG